MLMTVVALGLAMTLSQVPSGIKCFNMFHQAQIQKMFKFDMFEYHLVPAQ